MLVRIVRTLEDIEEINSAGTCLKEVLSLLPKDTLEDLKEYTLHFILTDSTGTLDTVELNPDIADTSFKGYDTLHLIRDVEGEFTAAILASTIAGAGMVPAAGLAGIGWTIGAMALNLALSLAVSAVIQALTPTQTFKGDASSLQNSPSLYNNAPLVREQGGSVPLICGEPFCGGVLISSSLSTSETVINVVNADKYTEDGLEWFNIPVTFTPVTIPLYSMGSYTAVETTFSYWDGVTETVSAIVEPLVLISRGWPSSSAIKVVNNFKLSHGYGGVTATEAVGPNSSGYSTTVSRETTDGGATYFFNILYKKQVF